MTTFLFIALVVSTGYLLYLVLPYRYKVRNDLRLSESIIVQLPLDNAREATFKFFGSLPHSAESQKDGVRIYERGIMGILRLDQIIPLHSVPHLVGVGFRSEAHHTAIEIGYRAMPTVKFSEAAADYFLEAARNEIARAREVFQGIASVAQPVEWPGRGAKTPVRLNSLILRD